MPKQEGWGGGIQAQSPALRTSLSSGVQTTTVLAARYGSLAGEQPWSALWDPHLAATSIESVEMSTQSVVAQAHWGVMTGSLAGKRIPTARSKLQPVTPKVEIDGEQLELGAVLHFVEVEMRSTELSAPLDLRRKHIVDVRPCPVAERVGHAVGRTPLAGGWKHLAVVRV